MDRKVIYWVLGVAFVITLALRLFIAFQSPYFSDDSAYFHLRQIENIKDTGVPLFNDPLSYGGRTHIFLPLFDYILAFFSFIFPLVYVAKIIPNVFASSIIFVVYSVVSKLIRKNDIAMYCALISSFIPIYFVNTVNSISVYSLAVPLFFLVVYYFLRLKDIDNSRAYLVLFIFLVLLSPSIIILIMAMIAYYIIMKTESLKLERAESEIIIFSVFLALWFYFLVYKKAFLMHSYSIVWQNMPVQVLSEFFYQISILEAIYLIGVFPFICGVYVVYLHLFRRKAKQIYFFISLVIVLALLIWFKLLQIDLGLVGMFCCFVLKSMVVI